MSSANRGADLPNGRRQDNTAIGKDFPRRQSVCSNRRYPLLASARLSAYAGANCWSFRAWARAADQDPAAFHQAFCLRGYPSIVTAHDGLGKEAGRDPCSPRHAHPGSAFCSSRWRWARPPVRAQLICAIVKLRHGHARRWHTTEVLSTRPGGPTGSPAYQRAADYVANRFKAAGLEPGRTAAFSDGAHAGCGAPRRHSFQPHQPGRHRDGAAVSAQSAFAYGGLAPKIEAPLTFRGYCGRRHGDIASKVVVFGTQREGLPSASVRAANAREEYDRLIALMTPTSPSNRHAGPMPRAQRLAAADSTAKPHAALAAMRECRAFSTLRAVRVRMRRPPQSGRQAAAASFEIPARCALLHVTQRDVSSQCHWQLSGSDPKLRANITVIAAHLWRLALAHRSAATTHNSTLDDAA